MRWLKRLSILALVAGIHLGPLAEGAAAQREHRVRSGESLARIARRHHVSVEDLAAANRIRNGRIRPGDVLTVPPRGVTYVRSGQTLGEIAREHDATVAELQRLNPRLRRGTLRAGERLILPSYQAEASTSERTYDPPADPGLVRIRRNEGTVTVRLLDGERRVTRDGLEQLAQLMRRHEEDEAELPHPRLVHLLAAISDHFGGRAITLVSGRRDATRFTRESSRHVSGQATDIRVDGVSNRALWDFCRSLAQTGCGYYPRSTFVHVDVREQAAQWVDWSRPGRRPVYGNLRGAWRRACRRRGPSPSPACAREGRRVTRDDAVPLTVVLTDLARALMPSVPSLAAGEEPDEEEEDGEGES